MNVLLVAPCFLIYGGLYLRTRILTLDQEITALGTTLAQQETTRNTQIYRQRPDHVWRRGDGGATTI